MMQTSSSILFVRVAVLAVAVAIPGCSHAIGQQTHAPTTPEATQRVERTRVSEEYGHIPLSFEANRGQADGSVLFLSRGDGYTLLLGRGEAVLALRRGKPALVKPASTDPRQVAEAPAGEVENSLLRMRLVSANPSAAAHGEDRQITRTNYLIGNDSAKWQTDIPNYGRVRYSVVYPGIDLVYYGNQSRLEHDFIVSPGADPARIRLAFDGADGLRIDRSSGDLIVAITDGASRSEVRLLKPVTYQESDGKRTAIPSGYKLLAGNRVAFSLGGYDSRMPLVIDPVLVYSTYIGGSGNSSGQGDAGNGIAVDSNGNAYIVGTTYSSDFPVTGGAFQTKNKAAIARTGGTVFVSKLNSTGTALIYSTFLGGSGLAGSGGDFGYAIAVDSTNHAYITGATYSRDFPLTCGAMRRTNRAEEQSGGTSVFVAELAASGNDLVYSTFINGTGNHATPAHGDVGQAIAVDAAGDAYLAGYTYSADFPRTNGAFQMSFEGSPTSPNAFVAKINPQGSAEIYSTLLGGSGGDFANAIAVDANGDAFVAGSTGSKDFPVTDGAFQKVSNGPTAFVTELNPAGAKAMFSTFLGGSGGDSAQGIDLDGNGFVYVAGATGSSDFPLTTGSVEDENSGVGPLLAQYGPTGFATKLKQDGSELEYSTYVEGMYTSIAGIAVDSPGAAYLTGTTIAQGITSYVDYGGFQATPDAIASTASGGNSPFLVKLDPTGTYLNYATLLSGSKSDHATAIALDASGNAYMTGSAVSTDFPVTAGTLQTSNKAAGAGNAFAAQFSLAAEANQTGYPIPQYTPVPTTTTLGGGLDMEYCPGCTCDRGDGKGVYGFSFSATMMPSQPGPAAEGILAIFMDGNDIADSSEGGTVYSVGTPGPGELVTTTSSWPVTWTIYAVYSGDSYYAGSQSDTQTWTTGENCPQPVQPDAADPLKSRHSLAGVPSRIVPSVRVQTIASPAKAARAESSGPKFTPTLETPTPAGTEILSGAINSDAATVPCKSPLLPLTVTVHQATRRYGAANPAFTYSVSGAVTGSPVKTTVSFTTRAAPTSAVGAYQVLASVGLSGAGETNYEVIVNEGSLTVEPAPLTVTIEPATWTYGAGVPVMQASVAGLLNGDKLTATPNTTQLASSPVGKYTVDSATYSGAPVSNYSVKIVPATLTISPAPLTVTPGSQTRFYGSPNHLTYNFDGLVNGDHPSSVSGAPVLSTTATASSPVGSYPVSIAKGTLADANYAITVTPGVLEVARAILVVLPNTVTITEGQPIPASFGYTLSGFVLGQKSSIVTGAPDLHTTVTSSSKPGAYPIGGTPGSLKARNYAFQVRGGYLVIAK